MCIMQVGTEDQSTAGTGNIFPKFDHAQTRCMTAYNFLIGDDLICLNPKTLIYG